MSVPLRQLLSLPFQRSAPLVCRCYAPSMWSSAPGGRTASSSSFAPPPKRSSWGQGPSSSSRQATAAWQGASAGFTAPQQRTSRSRKELQRRERIQASSAPPAPLKLVRPEVSPKRKRRTGSRAKHKHSTDLEDLNQAQAGRQRHEASPPGRNDLAGDFSTGDAPSALVPRFREPQIRRLVQRPVASLPRTPQFFVRFGPPMTAEDLTHDAPSVLVESRRLIDEVLERRQTEQSAPDYVAPDTPFWRVPPKVRNKKPPKWQAPDETNADAEARPPADPAEAAERLSGIVDLRKSPGGWR
ncbi:unnamed protein product, partial [Polarella glacialis]